jgi:hypothetical protein
MEAAVVGVGAPTVNLSVYGSFPLDADFGFGQATLAMPVSDSWRLCSAYLSVGARPGGDGSWLVSAYIWPQLAAALEGDGIFKPVTAEYISVSPRMTSDCETEEARAMPSGCLIFVGVSERNIVLLNK